MNCPSCGKEIDDNQKFCTNCGAKLTPIQETREEAKQNTSQPNNEIKDSNVVKSKKIIILSTVGLLLIITAMVSGLFMYSNTAIPPMSTIEIENLTARQALDKIVEKEQLLQKCTDNFFCKNKQQLFENLYQDLKAYTGSELNFDSKLMFAFDEEPKDITFSYKNNKEADPMTGETRSINGISEPKTNLITLVEDCEGGYTTYINHNHLVKKYSKFLNKEWQEYLNIRQIENNDRSDVAYYCDGYCPMSDNTLKWYALEYEFINKFPNFTYSPYLKERMNTYMENALNPNFMMQDEKGVVPKEVRQAFVKFLEKVNENDKYYKAVELWYDTMSKTDFILNDKFFKEMYEKTKDGIFEQEYNNYIERQKMLEETQQQTEEDKYSSPLFSRDEMKQGYEFAQIVKQIVNNKDINAFADLISYPIDITTLNNEQKINIQNEEQFIQLGADRIFTNEFIKEVCKDEDLFVSYRGFMMGNGPNLFYTYMDGSLKIYALSISK